MRRCFNLWLEHESNELKALCSVKEFLSEQELDNTPEKQVFPAVSHKMATISPPIPTQSTALVKIKGFFL